MRLVLALLLLVSVAARAQDAGTPAEASPPAAPSKVDELDFPTFLRGGSEAAAGLDVATAGELVHPSNPAALVASLRSAGAVLEGGQKSFAIQFNPYLLTTGHQQLYLEAIKAREQRLNRYLQDSAVTLALAEDTPYEGLTFDEGRFATLMAGASVDVFGERSIYGKAYSDCVATTLASSLQFFEQVDVPLPIDFPGDLAAYQAALASYPNALESARQAGIAAIREGLRGCTRKVRNSSSALFLSVGGRWVMPGLKAQDTDGVRIQRGFGAATYELLASTSSNVELALQLRALGERLRPGEPMNKWVDAGFSVGIASPRVLLRLEATQSFLELEGTGLKRASFVAASRVVLADNWAVSIGVQGEGEDMGDAIGQLRPSVILNLADLPSLVYPTPKSPQ